MLKDYPEKSPSRIMTHFASTYSPRSRWILGEDTEYSVVNFELRFDFSRSKVDWIDLWVCLGDRLTSARVKSGKLCDYLADRPVLPWILPQKNL